MITFAAPVAARRYRLSPEAGRDPGLRLRRGQLAESSLPVPAEPWAPGVRHHVPLVCRPGPIRSCRQSPLRRGVPNSAGAARADGVFAWATRRVVGRASPMPPADVALSRCSMFADDLARGRRGADSAARDRPHPGRTPIRRDGALLLAEDHRGTTVMLRAPGPAGPARGLRPLDGAALRCFGTPPDIPWPGVGGGERIALAGDGARQGLAQPASCAAGRAGRIDSQPAAMTG